MQDSLIGISCKRRLGSLQDWMIPEGSKSCLVKRHKRGRTISRHICAHELLLLCLSLVVFCPNVTTNMVYHVRVVVATLVNNMLCPCCTELGLEGLEGPVEFGAIVILD